MRVIVVSTGMLVNREHTKILLLRRKQPPYIGWWSFPGGKTEAGEELCTAVQREVKEETGANIKNAVLCVILNERLFRNGELQAHFLINYWKAITDEEEIIEQDTREGEIKWFSFEELPALIVPSDHKVLEMCQEEQESKSMTQGHVSRSPLFIEGVLEEVEDPKYPENTRLILQKWEQIK